MNNLLLDTIQGNPGDRPPVWFMRQAGRVLPSYQKLKKDYSFWQLMKDPKLAADVTALPLNDLGVDAAILFSDILVIPYAMGLGLDYTDQGPVFHTPLKDAPDPLSRLNAVPEKLEYIYDVIDELGSRDLDVPLIGFCGAPLTTMLYMIQGLGTRSDFSDADKFFYTNKKITLDMATKVTDLSIHYALEQIKHGVQVFQLFDTHAGRVSTEYYNEIFLPQIKRMADAVRSTGTPFIFFPKGMGLNIQNVTYDVCDYLSIDWQTSLTQARALVDPKVGLQGNLDPRVLLADKSTIEQALKPYKAYRKKHQDWIFNLGHGLTPDIAVENVQFVIDWVKETTW